MRCPKLSLPFACVCIGAERSQDMRVATVHLAAAVGGWPLSNGRERRAL